ncbi:uncharacterized protein LOC129940912, partial [Eupeodes corollae]|uniref:uncharacterized protein LOC129940912 n=1 Tax=Eupeodes corollae TaxID=290404 RepID=UPI002490B892
FSGGIWLDTNYQYLPNRRGGLNLIYNGYLYTAERKYNSTVNWVCNKNSNSQLKCPARCVTSGNNTIKLSRKQHNHEPVITNYDNDNYNPQHFQKANIMMKCLNLRK